MTVKNKPKGNPVPCPICKTRLPRIASEVRLHLRAAHGLEATQAETHRLITPKGFRGIPYAEGLSRDPRIVSGGLPSLGKRR